MFRFAPGLKGAQDDPAETDFQITGRILVVDDDRVSRATHRGILARKFDVLTASSGTEALEICREQVPDLIVLDAEMPDFDGYQTCRSLREWTSIPIIFATAHQSLEEHLKAYDAGGSDLILKPVNSEILLRKVSIAIQQYRAAVSLVEEKEALKTMAMGFLSGASQSGTLLNFMRASIVSQDYLALAQQLLGAIVELGLRCCVQIKHSEGATFVTEHGDPSPLEISIFEHTAELGRLFQFKRKRSINHGLSR